MDVELRDAVPQDHRAISEAIDREWRFSTYSKERGPLIAEYYLAQCLDGADHAVTAAIGGEPMGMLVLRDMGKGSVDASERIRELEEALSGDPGYEVFLKANRGLEESYRRFAEEYRNPDMAELGLLIVREEAKGHGIGRILIAEAKRLVTGAGMKGLFFYSDTDCNFGFYDHMSAERVGSASISYAGEPLTMFVYRLMFS